MTNTDRKRREYATTGTCGCLSFSGDEKDELAKWRMINIEMRFREEQTFSHRSLAGVAWWKCRIPNGAVGFAFL